MLSQILLSIQPPYFLRNTTFCTTTNKTLLYSLHEDHQFYNFNKHADEYGTAYYIAAPTKRELNSLLKLIDKWKLTRNIDIDEGIAFSANATPDYAIAIRFNIDKSYNLTLFDGWVEETKRFDTYQKLINYADRWFAKQTKED